MRKGLKSQSSLDPDKSIKEPIEDKYLPVYVKMDETIYDTKYDSTIIDIYKKVLDRQPTRWEILYYRDKFFIGEVDSNFLTIILYTGTEYEQRYMLQSNEVQFGLERSVYVKELYIIIKAIYDKYIMQPLDEYLLPVLMDVLIHLRYDLYLFIAFLNNKGFDGFVKDIKIAEVIDEFVEYNIFVKNINIQEVKDMADNIKMRDVRDGVVSIWSTIQHITDPSASNAKTIDYTGFDRYKSLKHLRDQYNDDNHNDTRINILNIDINRDQPFPQLSAPTAIVQEPRQDRAVYNSGWDRHKCRIYNPTNYNTPNGHQSVCTTLGQEQPVQPVYIQSKTLYNGTDIEESKKMSVGYIMPKFIYKEYLDIPCSIQE